MDATFERLRALDGKQVWAALLRAKDLRGNTVYRSGTFRLLDRPNAGANPVTRIVDDDGLPLVTFRGSDMLTVIDDLLRVALRPSFQIDVLDHPFEGMPESALLTYELVARELVVELEAGFRSALILRPDPDPDASARARRGLGPVEEGPLIDNSMRFAVGHLSATLRPAGDDGVRLTCVGSSLRDGRQFADLFEPAAGAHYPFEIAEIARLGADIRAFLSGRRERFVSFSGIV
jgi:hypothetical protein